MDDRLIDLRDGEAAAASKIVRFMIVLKNNLFAGCLLRHTLYYLLLTCTIKMARMTGTTICIDSRFLRHTHHLPHFSEEASGIYMISFAFRMIHLY